jgi:hypothetical protein
MKTVDALYQHSVANCTMREGQNANNITGVDSALIFMQVTVNVA